MWVCKDGLVAYTTGTYITFHLLVGMIQPLPSTVFACLVALREKGRKPVMGGREG
jgi:hypothetical protein